MKQKVVRKGMIATFLVVVLLASFVWLSGPSNTGNENSAYALEAPSFVTNTVENEISAAIQDEAGMAAYFKVDGPIDLDKATTAFQYWDQTPTYIIGAVEVDGYDETNYVHAYVHIDGWFMVYYFAGDPVGKIFDYHTYTSPNSAITTKFERVFPFIANAAEITYPADSLTYYHFEYPNATHIKFVAEHGSNDSFIIELPSSGFEYFERGFFASGTHGSSGVTVGDKFLRGSFGEILQQDLLTDTPYNVRVSNYSSAGGLVFIYSNANN